MHSMHFGGERKLRPNYEKKWGTNIEKRVKFGLEQG